MVIKIGNRTLEQGYKKDGFLDRFTEDQKWSSRSKVSLEVVDDNTIKYRYLDGKFEGVEWTLNSEDINLKTDWLQMRFLEDHETQSGLLNKFFHKEEKHRFGEKITWEATGRKGSER